MSVLKSIMDTVMKERQSLALKILNDEQIKTIKDSLYKGGKMESVNWTQESNVEVESKEPDDFLKIRETLSRINVRA